MTIYSLLKILKKSSWKLLGDVANLYQESEIGIKSRKLEGFSQEGFEKLRRLNDDSYFLIQWVKDNWQTAFNLLKRAFF